MQALTLIPGRAGSASLRELPNLAPREDVILARTLAVGVCGTDREILEGQYGSAPPGQPYLVLGHECLAEVIEAPATSDFKRGDLVVPIVRHPDPLPCEACAADEWDMCRNGQYTEHGIKGLDGFCAEQLYIDPRFAVRLPTSLRHTGVLLEPASVLAKAWDHIERIGGRSRSWRPRRVLVTGAGPIGLIAALMAIQRGCEVHVYDHNEKGPKRDLTEQLGATYHCEKLEDVCKLKPDVIIECTGASPVVATVIANNAASAIVCLTGLSSGTHHLRFDFTALNRAMVLENDVVFGTVNANRHHYELAAEALAEADDHWLRQLISRRVPLEQWEQALEKSHGDIKVVIDFSSNAP